MKVTLNWLKQYVDFNWSPEELTGWLVIVWLVLIGAFMLVFVSAHGADKVTVTINKQTARTHLS